ncbi:MAG: glycerophosphodiester phosphodiesterase [Planctomycetes bacterium]|nr:glycerophosphodiester phosphodiesterase [Planctomycetota bacterium]
MKRYIAHVLLCLFIVSISGCTKSVEIIAHRGASYLAPENTMASVMLGWEKGADVEVDVHLSKDNRIVVIHDSSTKRTGRIDLKVKETEHQKLRKLDVGSFKSAKYAGEPIPLLSDIIKTIPPGRKLYVEIKCGKEILPILKKLVTDSNKKSQIVIIGFDLETVTLSKELIDVPTYWLKGTDKDKKKENWIPHDPQLVQIVKNNGLDGLDVHYAGVTKEFTDAVKASGQKLYVWTVDDPAEAIRLKALGVAGITTNRPEWLRQQLENKGASKASIQPTMSGY